MWGAGISSDDLVNLQAALLLICLLLIGLRLLDDIFITPKAEQEGSRCAEGDEIDDRTRHRRERKRTTSAYKRSRAFSNFVDSLHLGADMAPTIFQTPRSTASTSDKREFDPEYDEAPAEQAHSHDEAGSPRKRRRHQL